MTDTDSPRLSRSGTRRGVANIELFGGDFMAERARSGIVARYLINDGLVEASQNWSPSTMDMYVKNVHRRATAKARAAKALKRGAALDAERIEALNGGAS